MINFTDTANAAYVEKEALYNAGREGIEGRMTYGNAPAETREAVHQLMLPWIATEGSTFVRLLQRHPRRDRYLVGKGLGEVLGVVTREPGQYSKPPRAYQEQATVHDMLTGLTSFLQQTGLDPNDILFYIGERLGAN